MQKAKRIIALILCIMTAASCFVFTSGASDEKFIDIVKGSWYYDGVMWAVEQGYFAGVTDNTFNPSGALTRAQLVTVLSAVDGTDTSKYRKTTNFSDVPSGVYYTGAVEWARLNAIVGGTGNNAFSPKGGVTREQICVMLRVFATEYLGYELKYVNNSKKFDDDASISSWAKDAVDWAQRCGLVSGIDSKHFSPKTVCTRAQVALIIKKLVEAIPQKVVAYYNMQASMFYEEDAAVVDVYNIHPTSVTAGPGSNPFSITFTTSRLEYTRSKVLKVNPDAKFIFTVANGPLATFESWLMPFSNCESFAGYFVDTVRTYNFDGVDIDYEFPTGSTLRPNFVKFIEYLRAGLDELGKTTGKKYTISLAVPAGTWAFSLFDMPALSEYVDWFNIMSYDLYIGSNYNMYTHHHAPAFDNVDTINYKIPAGGSVASDIVLYKENGIPASKIVPGCGMYAHRWTHVEPGKTGTGLYSGGIMDNSNEHYSSIIGYIGQGGNVRYWDDVSKAPYIYNAETKTFLSYDDLESVSYKADLVNKSLCGGLMVFDYCTCDGTGFFPGMNDFLRRSK